MKSWQAVVSLTLTHRNEGARGEARLCTSGCISLSDWCVPVKWSTGLSDMTLVSQWHTCSRLTVIGVDGPHSTQPAEHSYFDPLFFYFRPSLLVFRLLATLNQGWEMEAGPSGIGLLGMRGDERSNGEQAAGWASNIWCEGVLLEIQFSLLHTSWLI